MTEGANRAAEQALGRGVVHVDGVFVGKHELDEAKCVAPAWGLIEMETADIDRTPIDRRRVNLAATVLNLQVLARKDTSRAS